MKVKRKLRQSQLDDCTRNRIIGMFMAGAASSKIMKTIRKPDHGALKRSNVNKVIRKFKKNPDWRGDRKKGTGPVRLIPTKTRERIVQLVIAKRGSHVVTISFIKKRFVKLRDVSDPTISRALHEAGLAYLRRRQEKAGA